MPKEKNKTRKRQMKGFAKMSLEQRTEIARKGGNAVSRGRAGRTRMSENGRIGGTNRAKNLAAKNK